MYSRVGGYIGHIVDETLSVTINSNTNYGIIDMTKIGMCTRLYYGGYIGQIENRQDASKMNAVALINNTNNGKATLRIEKENEHLLYLGGLIGYINEKNNHPESVTELENNTNNGSIEGSFKKGKVYSGGLFGYILTKGKTTIRGNTNNGIVNISHTDGSCDYIGGIIGIFEGSSGQNMSDTANYGCVSSNSNIEQSAVCGLVCVSSGSKKINIENCVNQGTVEGTKAYGISNGQIKGKSIVSMGVVNGKNESYSFWETTWNEATLLYCLNETCVNCSDNVMFFKKNESDGKYQTMNERNDIVYSLLNEEAEKNEYYLRWDRNLTLINPMIIHIDSPVNQDVRVLNGLTMEECGVSSEILKYHLFVKGLDPSTSNEYKKNTIIDFGIDTVLVPYYKITIKGIINGTHFVQPGTIVGNVESLQQYINSDEYAVGDCDNNMLFLGNQTTIERDTNIIVRKKFVVVIDIDKSTVLASDLNTSEIAAAITDLTRIELTDILIEIELDEQGYVVRLVVMLSDSNECEQVVIAVNELDKGEQCQASVLCRSKSAHTLDVISSTMVVSLSVGSWHFLPYSLMLCTVFLFTIFF